MPRGRPKKIQEPEIPETFDEVKEPTEKEKLLVLYQELKDRNIRSISDLEGQIARAE